jgi:hypothetical protein
VAWVAERDLVSEVSPTLVLVDGMADFCAYLVQVALGPKTAALDADESIATDAVVRVGARGHRAITGERE